MQAICYLYYDTRRNVIKLINTKWSCFLHEFQLIKIFVNEATVIVRLSEKFYSNFVAESCVDLLDQK